MANKVNKMATATDGVKTAKSKVSKLTTKKPRSSKSVAAETLRTNVTIEKVLHERAKKFAAKNELSFTKLIHNAIKEYIKNTR